jgi:hypothetical protein
MTVPLRGNLQVIQVKFNIYETKGGIVHGISLQARWLNRKSHSGITERGCIDWNEIVPFIV